jgi:4-amino-4-deoxy-L-arabinose transferase-like glycosyltransferase
MRASRIIWFIFAVVAIQTLFSVPKLSWELASGETSNISSAFGLAVASIAVLLTWRYHKWLAIRFQHVAQILEKISRNQWISACIIAGILVRILWVGIFPAPPHSDYATYFGLAQSLVEKGSYYGEKTGYAYWPPGYPFFLAANFFVFGIQSWVPTFANLLLFSTTILVVYRLATLLADETVARLATLLLVIWPTYVASAGLASKEMLLVLLLPLAILLYLSSAIGSDQRGTLSRIFLAGTILGFASLTQPAMLLFPSVLLVYELLHRRDPRDSCLRLATVIIGMAIAIGPWAMRNHTVLNAWIPVSTSGGDVFYRANNSLATGGYIREGERSLEQLDEVQMNKRGYQWGIEWIFTNPGDFFFLALRKQTLFLGDDGKGVYETLKRGLEISGISYLLAKGLSTGYWWIVWVLILASLLYHSRSELLQTPELSMLMLSFLYLLSIHSVFESGARHHEPAIGLLAILAALLVRKPDEAPTLQN